MPRDPRIGHLRRLQQERHTRAAGRYHGTQATAYGDVVGGPPPRGMGRTILALLLLAVLIGLGLVVAVQAHTLLLSWLHLLFHALGFAPLSAEDAVLFLAGRPL